MNCTNCQFPLEPSYNYCPGCGTNLSVMAEDELRVCYNIFYKAPDGDSYCTLYHADEIRTLAAITQIVRLLNLIESPEHFVGSYQEEDCGETAQNSRSVQLFSWRRVNGRELEDDQGSKTVFVHFRFDD